VFCLTSLGINHGSNSFSTPSIKNHLRPFDYDTGAHSIKRNVRVDNVESHVGTGNNTSHIRSILLPYSQCQGKDKK
jgi:hypothetical protein